MTMDVPFNWGDPVIGVHRTYISSNIKKGVIWSNTQNYSNSKVDDILKILIELNENTKITIIMIEHIMRAVMSFSERVVCLDAGKIIANGTPDQVIKNTDVEKAYLGE